jgi:hypothetical protein
MINLPYDAGLHNRLKIYLDEHAYETSDNMKRYIGLIDEELKNSKKVFILIPGFLIGNSNEVNLNSAVAVNIENDSWEENLKTLLEYIKTKRIISLTRNYNYNFGTLGQLGRISVVELGE